MLSHLGGTGVGLLCGWKLRCILCTCRERTENMREVGARAMLWRRLCVQKT